VLRSLFGFAHRRRLVFIDPTRRLHVGAAPKRSTMPMTDDEIAVVKRAAVTAVQRLTVALVTIYAARDTAVRQLTIDDLDLSRRRVRIDGSVQRMPELCTVCCASG
jgi:site-specific recombinase XerD